MRGIISVDIGAHGAVALLEHDGALRDVLDLPILRDGPAGRPAINPALLAAIVREWKPERAFVEFVGARPGEGAVGAFAFGRSRGVVEGVLGSLTVPVSWLTPAHWKRLVGLTLASKDAARSEAIRRWPAYADKFARVKDDGRAEAALIGVAGLLRERQKGGAS